MNKKWFKNFFKKEEKKYIYFGDDSADISEYRNFNYLIVGPCGCGKSLNFFTPNIMNEKNDTIISLDLKKELYNKCKYDLEFNGYKTYYLDSCNFFNNIFVNSKIHTVIDNCDDSQITKILDDFYEVKDEDDYYSNIEISLLRAIAKELLINKKEIIFKDIFQFWLDLDFYHIESYFKNYDDEYIRINLDEFNTFTKDLGYTGLESLKKKIKNKFITSEKNISDFNFDILRKEKIAVFFETNNCYHNEQFLNPLIINLFNQLISNNEGLKIKIFLDDLFSLKKLDNLKEILALSRGRNYSLYIGLQSFYQLDDYKRYNYKDIIPLFDNFILFGMNPFSNFKYLELLNILGIKIKPIILERLKLNECIFCFLKKDKKFDFKYIKFGNNDLLKKITIW